MFAGEPEFNFKAALLGVPNARTGKPFPQDRFGIFKALPPRSPGEQRAFDASVEFKLHGRSQLELTPHLTVNGTPVPLPSIAEPITARWLALYSRAVHKILFEWYAYLYHVTHDIPADAVAPTDPRFDDIRRFVKEGQPRNRPRPILRWHEDMSNAMNLHVDTHSSLYPAEMNLMGTHYAAVLAGSNDAAEQFLTGLAAQSVTPVLTFADELRTAGTAPFTSKSFWKIGDQP